MANPYAEFQQPASDPYAEFQKPATVAPVEKPSGWATYLHEINPMNTVPAMVHGFIHSLTNTPLTENADALKALGSLKYKMGPPAPTGQPAYLDDPANVPTYGQMAGHAAATATNAGLLGVAVPEAMGLLGRGLKAAGIPVAESAAGIRAIDRANGRTPGAALLENTSGIRPSTVLESTRKRIGLLNDQYENLANQATTPTSLQPARDILAQRSAQAAAGNSVSTPAEMAKMQSQLTNPTQGFAGAIDPATGEIAAQQDAATLLRMKREFGKDHTSWRMNPSPEVATAQRAYGAIDGELDRAIPQGAAINQEISSLIPVKQGLKQKDLNAGIIQNIMHKAAVHTGALATAVGGGMEFGPLGAAAGLILPEAIASPTARMAAARGLYGAGGLLQSTPIQQAAQAALLQAGLNKRKGLLQ